MNNSQHALVVEGGAMRGIFAAGVLDEFLAQQYQPFTSYFGVSAGATNVAAYLCKQATRNYKVITDYSCRPEFINLPRFVKGGHLFDLDWLWQETVREIPLNTDEFTQSPHDFYIVATAIESGQAHYLQATGSEMVEQLKASCAIPIAYRDYPKINGIAMTDGGVADSIPVKKAYEMGASEITVILSQPLGYRKKDVKVAWLTKQLYKNTPALAQASLQRSKNYNSSISFLHNALPDCKINIIAPPAGFKVGRTTKNLAILNSGYQMGINEAKTYLGNPRLREK
ncbi:ratatin-like phospholipase [Pseudoalteromonas sp. BSi20311]|uniref:patatin-like phospholipase family protein n=1 Tax=Pseudoalteromonas sp. BSi20311 TaxID=383911 RepID=UPI0002317C5C|nr:patatin family protein [Pseudoalteromonas sp. BSi20311]GAA65893.1 ratatin-like phospholipase [Pseudoalteromonas sp. BSi20311]